MDAEDGGIQMGTLAKIDALIQLLKNTPLEEKSLGVLLFLSLRAVLIVVFIMLVFSQFVGFLDWVRFCSATFVLISDMCVGLRMCDRTGRCL